MARRSGLALEPGTGANSFRTHDSSHLAGARSARGGRKQRSSRSCAGWTVEARFGVGRDLESLIQPVEPAKRRGCGCERLCRGELSLAVRRGGWSEQVCWSRGNPSRPGASAKWDRRMLKRDPEASARVAFSTPVPGQRPQCGALGVHRREHPEHRARHTTVFSVPRIRGASRRRLEGAAGCRDPREGLPKSIGVLRLVVPAARGGAALDRNLRTSSNLDTKFTG